jgi:hypothetical protein
MLLYAQAAVGPEYVYPACLLQSIAGTEYILDGARCDDSFTALNWVRSLNLLQPFCELGSQFIPCGSSIAVEGASVDCDTIAVVPATSVSRHSHTLLSAVWTALAHWQDQRQNRTCVLTMGVVEGRLAEPKQEMGLPNAADCT